MAGRPDIDAICGHIATYCRREPWPSFRREHLVKLLGSIPEAYDLAVDGIFDEVQRLGHLASMIGFLDESFLSGEHGPERMNPIDDYLRRRGWQETPRARAYLQGIRDTPPALYEVQDVASGDWVEVRDRLSGGPIQRVGEHSASQTLQRWDCLVARIVMPHGERMFTGGVLSLTRDTAARIEELYRRVVKAGRKSVATAERELGLARGSLGDVDSATESLTDRICFHVWLRAMLDAARRPPPQLQNTDGEPLLFARTRLQVTPGAAAEVGRRLDQLEGWNRDPDGKPHWTWSGVGMSQSATVRGMAKLEGGVLVVEVNSRRRMEDALVELHVTLGPLVTAKHTIYEDPIRAVLERAGRLRDDAGRVEEAHSAEQAAAMAEVVRRAKDAHYRRTLGEPIAMLGNKTPRQCRRSKQGRMLLLEWLKELENHELRHAADAGTTPYDMSWIWQELGIGRER
jgi:hypothetical protein